MFSKNFYPTPNSVLRKIKYNFKNKIVLEPHGGKANIIDFLRFKSVKKVYFTELNKDLHAICSSRNAFSLGHDFFDLRSEDVAHIDVIIMNPPFENAEKHIKHALNIKPANCDVISLCNYSLISNPNNYNKRELVKLATSAENLGTPFVDSERSTNVEVGVLYFLANKGKEENIFSSEPYFIDEDFTHENGLRPYNYVRDIVQRHVGAVLKFQEMYEVSKELNALTKKVGMQEVSFAFNYSDKKKVTTPEEFLKLHQKKSWSALFKEFKLEKFLPTHVMQTFYAFMEKQEGMPFTMKRVYEVFDTIIQTREENLKKAVIEVIDNFTKYTHKNRYHVEGWKTNLGHMLNKKFIIENGINENFLAVSYRRGDQIRDLIKAMCFILGIDFNSCMGVNKFSDKLANEGYGMWIDFPPFFEIKAFKKGTLHVKFKDLKHWEIINRAYAEALGASLPEKI